MIPLRQLVVNQLKWRNNFLMTPLFRQLSPVMTSFVNVRHKSKQDKVNVNSLFQRVPVEAETSNTNVGVELTGELDKSKVSLAMSTFVNKQVIRDIAISHGFEDPMLKNLLIDFRNFCMTSKVLPADLHITLNDVIKGAANVTDIFPYFLHYAKQSYPHIECMDELKRISDLRHPPNWYPLARAKTRKIIFHAGPTNSGKTHHALQSFMSAKTGVYCGPLKLLAVEVHNKCNSSGTSCDLITGEERNYVKDAMNPSNHVSCSVEMVNVLNHYEVAVIDEIQLLRDQSRGWAWTRALLGIVADEIHLCGESAAISIVKSICATTGETVEIREYKRLTELHVENRGLNSFSYVQPGDCIVCFSKNDIFYVSQTIEKLGMQVAVIYGSLPPGTKIAQTARFNDPNDKCKVLVATNAIGMGLNLHIRRIIFYSLQQPTVNEYGEKELSLLSVSSALQIAGRAGRYNTQWEKGYVTTFKSEDLKILKQLLSGEPEIINKAGLHPTSDQIELYSYYLPNTPLSNLVDIFVALSQVDDSLYFICNLEDFKFVADLINHVPLSLPMQYIFCCAPVNKKASFTCNMLLKYARQCSKNEKVTVKWLQHQIKWPPKPPGCVSDLVHLETVFDALDIYLWLSYRFIDLFPDAIKIREIQKELDKLIEDGIKTLKKLFQKEAQDEEYEFTSEDQGRDAGKLTEKLISQGRLTPRILQQLQKEWSQEKWKAHSYKRYKNNPVPNQKRRYNNV